MVGTANNERTWHKLFGAVGTTESYANNTITRGTHCADRTTENLYYLKKNTVFRVCCCIVFLRHVPAVPRKEILPTVIFYEMTSYLASSKRNNNTNNTYPYLFYLKYFPSKVLYRERLNHKDLSHTNKKIFPDTYSEMIL